MPQQRVPEPPGLDAAESYWASALVTLLSRFSSVPIQVHEAVEALRELIAERVLREVRSLEKTISSKMETLKTTINSRIDAIEKTANGRIDALEKTVNSRIDALGARIDALEKSLGALR